MWPSSRSASRHVATTLILLARTSLSKMELTRYSSVFLSTTPESSGGLPGPTSSRSTALVTNIDYGAWGGVPGGPDACDGSAEPDRRWGDFPENRRPVVPGTPGQAREGGSEPGRVITGAGPSLLGHGRIGATVALEERADSVAAAAPGATATDLYPEAARLVSRKAQPRGALLVPSWCQPPTTRGSPHTVPPRCSGRRPATFPFFAASARRPFRPALFVWPHTAPGRPPRPGSCCPGRGPGGWHLPSPGSPLDQGSAPWRAPRRPGGSRALDSSKTEAAGRESPDTSRRPPRCAPGWRGSGPARRRIGRGVGGSGPPPAPGPPCPWHRQSRNKPGYPSGGGGRSACPPRGIRTRCVRAASRHWRRSPPSWPCPSSAGQPPP